MPGLHFTSGIDNGFEKDLRRMNGQLNTFANDTDTTMKKVAAGVATYFSGQALIGFANKLIDVRGEFEKLGIAFETMLGDKTAADALMRDVTTMAAKTPFSLTEVASGAKQLLAFGESSETVIDTLRRMGDIAAGTGTDIGGLNLAYGQVMSKGKLQTQEMYQFAERGVPIMQELANVMGVTKAEVSKLVEKGQVGFPIVQQALQNLTNEGGLFFNLMEKQSASVSGMVSNLGDAFESALNDIGAANEDIIKGGITGLIKLTENWEQVVSIVGKAVLIYGTYKTALMVTSALQKASQKTFSEGSKAEAESLLKNISLEQQKALGITNINKLNEQQIQLIKELKQNELEALQIELKKNQMALQAVSTEGKALKQKITNTSLLIQAEKQNLSQAIKSKDLTAARVAQERLSNLEKQKATLLTNKQTLTTQAANIATQTNSTNLKLNTLQTQLSTAADRKAVVSKNLMTVATNRLTIGFKQLTATLLANPLMAIATALSIVIPKLIQMEKEAVKAKISTKEFNAELNTEQGKVNDLFEALKKTNPKSKEREQIITKLNEQYPDLLHNYDLDVAGLSEIESAQKRVNDEILRTIANRMMEADLETVKEKAEKKSGEAMENILDLTKNMHLKGMATSMITELVSELRAGSTDVETAAKEIAKLLDINQYVTRKSSTGVTSLQKSGKLLTIEDELQKLLKYGTKLEIARQQIEDFYKGLQGAAKTPDPLFEPLIIDEVEVQDIVQSLTITREAYLKQLELNHQIELNKIANHYKDKKNQERDEQREILQQQQQYLQKRLKIISTYNEDGTISTGKPTIDVEKAKTQLIEQQRNYQAFLQELANQYLTYSQNKENIEKKYEKDIADLRAKGLYDNAKIAEQQRQQELTKLDESLLQADSRYQEWLKITLPQIAKQGIEAMNKELTALQFKFEMGEIEGMSAEEVVALTARIKKLKEAMKDVNEVTTTGKTSFKDYLEIINGINELIKDLTSSFENMDAETESIISGITDSISGFLGMANAIKAVGAATGALEKATAILAIISAVVKVISAIVKIGIEMEEQRKEKLMAELQIVQDINLALVKQIQLYKEGNELFADDKWGSALAGLSAYNEALNFQKQLLTQMAQNDEIKKSKKSNTSQAMYSGTAWKTSFGTGMLEAERLYDINQAAKQYATDLEKALAGVAVKTRDRSGFANFFGVEDEFEGLLQLYPELIGENGRLNTELLQAIISSENLSELDKQRLTNLLELTNAAEEGFAQFGDYIASIFGGLGDEIASTFQTMYEEGDKSMKGLTESMSEMIESFTRDTIEFAYLQPFIDQLNQTAKKLGTDYAAGSISAEDLQIGIIQQLGAFYKDLNTIQPQILEAYKRADELAAEQGFDEAFNTDEGDTQQMSTGAQVQQAITEQTGSELVGRMGALMLSNERLVNINVDMLDLATKNLVILNQIKLNTDYLPVIAENTRKTVDKLSNY